MKKILFLLITVNCSLITVQARSYLRACGDSLFYNNVCEVTVNPGNARIMAPQGSEAQGMMVNVYPNPANDKLNVSATLPVGAFGEIIFYDGIGNRIISVKLTEGVNSSEIDLSKIAAGVYYYKVFANHQTIKTDKLIIIK